MKRDAINGGGIDGGRLIIAFGAILMLVALFLDWYGFDLRSADGGMTAWTAFEIVDLVLALLALAAIAAAIEPLTRRTSRVPDGIETAAGPAALVLVIVSIINFPPAAQGLEDFNTELEVGAWLALAGAAIMCAGALLALNRVSLVVTPRDSRTTPGPAARQSTRPADRGEDTRASETETRPLPPR